MSDNVQSVSSYNVGGVGYTETTLRPANNNMQNYTDQFMLTSETPFEGWLEEQGRFLKNEKS